MFTKTQKGFIPIVVAAFVVAIAVAMVGVAWWFHKEQIDRNRICCGANTNAVTNTNTNQNIIKETCGNVISYGWASVDETQVKADCQTRGGTFNGCDSPCGSMLTVCQKTCTFPTNTNTTNQNVNTNTVPSDWQTYTNDTYHFLIKYPSNSFTTPQENATYVRIQNYDPNGPDKLRLSSGDYYLEMSFNTSSGDDWCATQVYNSRQYTFGTKSGLRGDRIPGGDAGGVGKVACVDLGQTNVYVSSTVAIGDEAKADLMINTLNFINETAGWKTYTSTTLNYSINYPQDWILDEAMRPSTIQILPPNYREVSSLEMTPAVFIKDLDKMLTDELTTDKRDVTINGISAKRQIEHGFAAYNYTYFPKSSRYISVHWADLFSDNYPQYETILSTFQLTQ